jgi:hypothetical protein
MKPNRKLLQDILNDTADSLRREIFEASLRELRRRRRIAQLRKVWPLAIAAVLALNVCLLFLVVSHQAPKQARVLSKPVQLNSALAYARVDVVTNHWPAMDVMETRKYQSLIVDNSSVHQPMELLDDTGLLALFPDKPVGLIADSRGAVQLVFLDRQEQGLH